MDKPTLTVGVSFYNTADTLHDLARCIFAQTFADWELLLVDDGSKDDGAKIARAIRDPRVRVIVDGVNRGRSARYNQITDLARGEFLARFDADDLCDPQRFEKQIAFLRAHPEVDLVASDMLSLDPNDEVRGHRRNPADHETICRAPLRAMPIAHGGALGRTEWFRRHRYSEQFRIAIDYCLWLSSFRTSRFASIPEPLYFYREYATHDLKKYWRTNRAVWGIIDTFGREGFSRATVAKARWARWARVMVYSVATVLGLHERLVARRSEPATQEDHERFARALQTIRQTVVPGLEEALVGKGL